MEEIFCNEIVRYLLPHEQHSLRQLNKILYQKLIHIPTVAMIRRKERLLKELILVTSDVREMLDRYKIGEYWKLCRLVQVGEPEQEEDEELGLIIWQDYQLNTGNRITFDNVTLKQFPQQLWLYFLGKNTC